MSYLSDLLGKAYKEGMTEDEISAALETVGQGNEAEVNRLKAALSKANSEAADYKKQLRTKQTDDEAAAAAQKEEHDRLVQENADLNSELWLQAAYIYEALLDASPVFNPLSKKNKPFPFRSEPIPITASGSKQSDERKKKQRLENGKEAMRAMMAAINDRFKKKKEGGEANNGS